MTETRTPPNLASGTGGEIVVPRDGAAGGRLRFTVGAENCQLVADETVGDGLCHVHPGKPRPEVRATGPVVHVTFPRLRGWSRRHDPTVVRLNPEVRWTIEIAGGAQGVTVDLRRGVLEELAVRGGASGLEVRLPAPRGTRAVRFGRSVSGLRISRPAGVPVRLYVQGGASGAQLDDQHFGGVGGPMHWQSPGYGSATDRYDIAVAGAASDPTLATDA